MKDQGLSGDAPRDPADGPGCSTGDPKGSRTPGVGAANGRRPDINIETPTLQTGPFSLSELCVCGHTYGFHLHPRQGLACANFRSAPLPSGTPISSPPRFGFHPDISGSHPSGRIFTPTLCVCGHTLLAHLSPDAQEVGVLGCSGFRPAPDRRCVHGNLFTESCPGCGYIHPRDRSVSDLTDQEVDDLHAHLGAIAGIDLDGSHPVGFHPPASEETAPRRARNGSAAASEAGTFLLRIFFYTPIVIVLGILFGILFLGYTGDADD